MNFNVVYSRDFLVKVFSWPAHLRQMAFQAAEHAAQNPNLNDYIRPYLTPYKQKHPTTDHQYTLYFTIESGTEIFVVWINDDSCLHTTRANYSDPCLKEFQRLQAAQKIEKFDRAVHIIKFEVHPNSHKPVMCRSSNLGYNVQVNSHSPASNLLIAHSFYCWEPVDGIAVIHIRQFLNLLHAELSNNHSAKEFRIEFTKQGHIREADLITQAYDSRKWQIIDDRDDFILKKI